MSTETPIFDVNIEPLEIVDIEPHDLKSTGTVTGHLLPPTKLEFSADLLDDTFDEINIELPPLKKGPKSGGRILKPVKAKFSVELLDDSEE